MTTRQRDVMLPGGHGNECQWCGGVSNAVRLRVFQVDESETGRRWLLDGVDSSGHWTLQCWEFHTFAEAVESLPAFWQVTHQDDETGV